MGAKKISVENLKGFLSKNIIWGVLITIIVSFITIPNIITKADNDKVIKVLEVEPGNGFVLNNASYNGYKVEVTQIDMPTFISMVNEIDGSYDVVYIGRKQINKDGNPLKMNWDTYYTNRYRDYSNPFQFERGQADSLKYTLDKSTNNQTFISCLQSIWYGTLGLPEQNLSKNALAQSGKIKTTIMDENNVAQSKTVREYFSENDITNRRAKEINKMIDSNQLVYVDNKIFSDDIKHTILHSNFSNYRDLKNKEPEKYSNFSIVDDLTIQIIVDNYDKLSKSEKRPTVKVVSSPKGDTAVATSSAQKIADRKLDFTVNLIKPESNAEYRAKLYLDFDGDGLFEDTELIPGDYSDKSLVCGNNTGDGTGDNKIEYTLDNKFIGYLDWKIEVYKYDSNNEKQQQVKTNLYGNTIFHAIDKDQRAKIRVLQLYPVDTKNNNKTNLDLTKQDGKYEFYKQAHQSVVTDDYDITIDEESVSNFNKENMDYIMGHYNMIIVGFADGYGNDDGNAFDENGIAIINEFNKEKKSLMFTHDTMSLKVLGNSKVDDKDTYSSHSGLLTQQFRDIIGQARYVDPYNNVNPKLDIFKIPEDQITLGVTAYSSSNMYKNFSQTSLVKQVNEGEITSYPFDLNKAGIKQDIKNSDCLNITPTHCQWFQLNLEDEKLVPWYNLCKRESNSNNQDYFNVGDSRNFYYTYSKENITYSGTGHSNNYTTSECQLFVNTIIKAFRGSNTPPVITNYQNDNNKPGKEISEESVTDVYADKSFSFISKIYDQETKNDDDITVSAVTDDNKTLYYNNQLKYKVGGVFTDPITLDSEYLSKRIGQIIKITVTGVDASPVESSKIIQIHVLVPKAEVHHGFDITNGNSATTDWSFSNLSIICNELKDNKPYYSVIPFIGYVKIFNPEKVTLNLDLSENFSANKDDTNNNGKRAYPVDGHSNPIVYVVADGKLHELKEMAEVNGGQSYTCELNKLDFSSIKDWVDSSGYCYIVVKYSGKTYNHVLNGSLSYNNTLTVARDGCDPISGNITSYVDCSAMSGTLY